MKQLKILYAIIMMLTMTASFVSAQQNQPLTKIRVDEKGDIGTLVKKETTQEDIDSSKMENQEIQTAQSSDSSLSKPASLPDLYYYLESYTYTHPNLQVNATIANKGDATAESFDFQIFISNNFEYLQQEQSRIIHQQEINDLHPAAYRTISCNYDVTECCGNWNVYIYVDCKKEVPESDETNNGGTIGPPLYIEEGCFSDLWGYANIIDSQGPVIDICTICNESGNCPFTTTHDVATYLSTDQNITKSDYLILKWTAYSGVKRSVYNYSGPFIPSNVPAGEYYLATWVDVDDVVAETDETNNIEIEEKKITIPGSPATKPDLIVTSVSVTDGSGPGIAYQFSVKNQGSASTGEGFRSDIYLSSDQTITSSDYKINEQNFGALGAGATHNSGAIQTTVEGVPAGDYYLGVIADGGGNIPESNENNNTGYAGSPKVNMPGGYEEPDEPDGNLISNWSFSDGLDEWTFATMGGGNATGTIESGAFHAAINSGGGQLWEVRLFQDDLTIVSGKTYTVTFQARADESRDTWATVGTGSEPFITYNSNWLFSLTSDWQTYTYTFTMGYSTNPNALMTFNFGTSNADVYLDNISLVQEVDEPWGNMISNWSFNNDMTDWTFNTAESGNAEAKVENGVFHAEITHGGGNVWNVSLYQYNLNIIKGNTYTVTFDAKAESPRDILSAVAMSVSPFWLYNFEPTFSLTTNWQTYTYTFTMGFDTDPAARLGFDFGASDADVYLDHISCVEIASATDVDSDRLSQTVRTYKLFQNYPNPFNPVTTIRFQVPEPRLVSLKIFDLLGHEVAELVNEKKGSGIYSVEWNGKAFPSGLYLYRLRAGEYTETRKLVLQK